MITFYKGQWADEHYKTVQPKLGDIVDLEYCDKGYKEDLKQRWMTLGKINGYDVILPIREKQKN